MKGFKYTFDSKWIKRRDKSLSPYFPSLCSVFMYFLLHLGRILEVLKCVLRATRGCVAEMGNYCMGR